MYPFKTSLHSGSKPNPLKLYLGLQFLKAAALSMAFVVASLYEADVARLSGWQLVLVGTTLEATILLFEIPTGVLADAYSRRLSIILGCALLGLGFLVEGFLPAFLPILVAQLICGIGYTFTSGATQAWLSDEIGEGRANQAFLSGAQFELAGALVGMLLAIPLGVLGIRAPMLAGGVTLLGAALALTWLMPENGFRPTPPENRNTFQHMAKIARSGMGAVRQRPAMLALLGVGLTYGVYSEGWDRLWVKYLIDHFSIPVFLGMNEVAFFAVLRACGMVLSIICTRTLAKRIDANHGPSIARAMMWTTGLLAAAILTFAFSGVLGASVLAVWLVDISRSVKSPLYDAWINQRLDAKTRATVLSMTGQVDALGQISSGPIAALISLWSVRAAITAAATLLLPAFPLIRRADRLHALEAAADADAWPHGRKEVPEPIDGD